MNAAWISQPRIGESVNGDAVVVRELSPSSVLIAIVDALGHGPKAAEVAQKSSDWLEEASGLTRAHEIVEGLHEHLKGSRGAAMLAVVISSSGLEACSVGNVDLRTTNTRLPFVLTPGVLGIRLRAPKTCHLPAPVTDRFVLFSDGISGRFELKGRRNEGPAAMARYLFGSHRHTHDDASVLVLDIT